MDFESFVEGPLLWGVFLVFIIGIVTRLVFFFLAITRSAEHKNSKGSFILTSFGRLFLPFHKAITKRPVYATLRYIFHICLIVVPIWLGAHIVLWEESRFEWSWTALPDAWADWMTLLLLGLAAYFLIRRIVLSDIRTNSSKSDYFLIVMAALPFLTGYLLTHDSLDPASFLADNMRTIHVLSSEAMLIFAVFLFYRTRLIAEKCTGCAACELSCPTATIASHDEGRFRTFKYLHYQCTCCGACVDSCPEDAAALRHEIGLGRFFQIASKREIRSVELKECEKCGALFAPEPLLGKIRQTIAESYIQLCPNCKYNHILESQDT
ncbi:MAG: 4Fe-4S dicluster domain-containing protein [Desulfatiglandales bacterium]